MGEGLGDGQGEVMGYKLPATRTLSVPATFLNFFFPPFFRLAYTSLPLFYPESRILLKVVHFNKFASFQLTIGGIISSAA